MHRRSATGTVSHPSSCTSPLVQMAVLHYLLHCYHSSRAWLGMCPRRLHSVGAFTCFCMAPPPHSLRIPPLAPIISHLRTGCEAALASARMGCKTLLLTLNLDRIAWQPCNPAVGGPAKSQLVHEVDAMGGEIGKMADRCYLQKRILNRSKVRGGGLGSGLADLLWTDP